MDILDDDDEENQKSIFESVRFPLQNKESSSSLLLMKDRGNGFMSLLASKMNARLQAASIIMQ